RRRHTRFSRDWSSDVCSSDLKNNRLIADIMPSAISSSPRNFILYNNKLYFTAWETTTGRELYEYDATTDEIKLIMDINPGTSWRSEERRVGKEGRSGRWPEHD